MLLDRCRPKSFSLAGVLLAIALPAFANTYVVTNTSDSGAGSLRQAILDANANPSSDVIDFAIPGSGVHVITPGMPVMLINDPVFLDGVSQPGSVLNTAPPGQPFNSVIQIEIDGLLELGVGSSTIRGLSVGKLVLSGVGAGAMVTGCYLGVDPSGTTPMGAGLDMSNSVNVQIGPSNLIATAQLGPNANGTIVTGNLFGLTVSGHARLGGVCNDIQIERSHDVTIGGSDASARNVISGCANGILAVGGPDPSTNNLQVLGNYIGTDVSGTRLIAPGDSISTGIDLGDSIPNSFRFTIARNVIGGYGEGIHLLSMLVETSLIQGNFIGTDETATRNFGNVLGISVVQAGGAIGGIGPGEANVIAHNYAGMWLQGVCDVYIRSNRFIDNERLGIDLLEGADGITLNDTGDEDSGPDGLQNFPIVTSVVPGSTTTHIEGKLNTNDMFPDLYTYVLDFYAQPACAGWPRGFVAGVNYLGSTTLTTDAAGNAAFALDVPVVVAADDVVTATATAAFPSCDICGMTSEFLPRIVFNVDPPTGPAGQPTPVTIHGMLFEDGATVTVGGVPAGNVVVTSPTTITATMPTFPAGTLHDVKVTLPSGPRNTLPNGWLTDFTDMPTGNIFHDAVLRLVGNGISVGTGAGQFGAANPMLREQMAVFLLKAAHGQCYAPTACAGVFTDVPCSSPFAPFIEELAAEGITAGCGGGAFCPTDPIRRDQMAVFLLKFKFSADHVPPPCVGLFDDVPCPSPFSDWIEELALRSITAGCGNSNYCPADPVTRAQMAAFIGKTAYLP